MRKKMTVRAVLLAMVCTAAVIANAVADMPKSVNVQAGELAEALETLARQCGVFVIYPSDQVKGFKTRGVSGTLEPREAFTRLIEGTNLTLKIDSSGAMLIALPAPVPPSSTSVVTDSPLRLAAAQSENQAAEQTEAPASQGPLAELGEVVVVGTHIRGVPNGTSPVLVFDREALQKTGYSTVEQFMDALPQNFGGGGVSEDGVLTFGVLSGANATGATGVNLRGLGNSSTLVLLNGHRLASATGGSAVDISTIPLTAIERVEVLTDGSSAVYGSDAVAGVVNIVLRRNSQGPESALRYGKAAHSGSDERIASQSVGTTWHAGSALVNLQYRSRDALLITDRDFAAPGPQPTDLLPNAIQRGVTLSAHHALGSGFDVFTDALYSNRSTERRYASNAASRNSWSGSVEDMTCRRRIGLCTFRRLAYGPRSRLRDEQICTRVCATGTGQPGVSHQWDTAVRVADGGTQRRRHSVRHPGRGGAAGAGSLFGKEQFDLQSVPAAIAPATARAVSRDVKAVFAELYVPLVGESNDMRFVHRLGLSLSGRYDDYSDFGKIDESSRRHRVVAWRLSVEIRAA